MYNPVVSLHVMRRIAGKTDRLGNELVTWSDPELVKSCLFAPGTPADLGLERPDGVTITATAHFPTGYSEILKGALVSLDGKNWLEVVGEPISYPPGTIPGKWSLMALLKDVNG